MPALSPGDTSPVPLTPRMTLRPAGLWQGDAHVAPPSPGVLGEASPATTTFELFTPAEPPIELDARPAPAVPGVLGAEEQAGIEYQPDDAAAYVLLQEIHTPDGIIYDFTLPRLAPAPPPSGVLSGEPASAGGLWFPINPVVMDGGPSAPEPTGVLGVGDLIGGAVSGFVIKRVVQMLKSPIQQALLAGVRHAENQPRVLRLTDSAQPDERFQPLEGFEAWRALLPPGAERRVLLFVHGFASSVTGSHIGHMLPELAQGYDAVLGYDHPTIARDPIENARELLAMIPEDLRLSVDILAHSRGGLVSRSLIELVDPVAQFAPRRLVTHGSPHGGTRLADPERWDRIISLGMTAASWLALAAGAAIWIPKLLEFVLKAAAQGVFDLPGIAAMTPKGDFITKLNSPNAGLAERVRYSAVTSSFSIFNVKQAGFQQAFRALAAQTFIDAPNDLVVPTASMSAIDAPISLVPAERQLKLGVDHFSYFGDAQVLEFLRAQLGGD
jgi:hypothetical protein